MDPVVPHLFINHHPLAPRRSTPTARHRVLALGVAVLAWTTTAAIAAEPVQLGPTVTITASRDALSPSETAYVEAAHQKLQKASRYPSGREASLERPSGTTIVWANVGHDGRVKGRGVEQSSGSPLLDGMARSLIGRARFPAMAAGDFASGATQKFVVAYAFDGVSMTSGRAGKVAAQ